VPVDNLEGFTVGVTYFGDMDDLVNPTVVSPDAGGVYRCAVCFKNVCCVIVGAGVGLGFTGVEVISARGHSKLSKSTAKRRIAAQFIHRMVFRILHLPSESQPVLNLVCYTKSHRRAKQFRDLLARKHGVDSGLAMIIKQRAKVSTPCAVTALSGQRQLYSRKDLTAWLRCSCSFYTCCAWFSHQTVLLTIFGVLCGEHGWGLRLSP
jgi:hypothetical protein